MFHIRTLNYSPFYIIRPTNTRVYNVFVTHCSSPTRFSRRRKHLQRNL